MSFYTRVAIYLLMAVGGFASGGLHQFYKHEQNKAKLTEIAAEVGCLFVVADEDIKPDVKPYIDKVIICPDKSTVIFAK
jgi:hypothetical protein